MSLEPPYVTPRDESLDHQVIFVVLGKKSAKRIHVSCNCLKNSRGGHDSMGQTCELTQSRKIYNNPDNHRKPFTQEDEAKW